MIVNNHLLIKVSNYTVESIVSMVGAGESMININELMIEINFKNE